MSTCAKTHACSQCPANEWIHCPVEKRRTHLYRLWERLDQPTRKDLA